jgi:hypothetical protein
VTSRPNFQKCRRCGLRFAWAEQYHGGDFCGPECEKLWGDRPVVRGPRKRLPDEYHIFERDNFQCIYCGKTSFEDGIALNMDHIRPRAHGGADTIDNLVTACRECNHTKAASLLHPDLEHEIIFEVERRNVRMGYAEHAAREQPVSR